MKSNNGFAVCEFKKCSSNNVRKLRLPLSTNEVTVMTTQTQTNYFADTIGKFLRYLTDFKEPIMRSNI